MEHLERLVPLAVLLGIAAFLAVLLRRVRRENTVVEPRRERAMKPAPVVAPVTVVALKQETPRVVAPVDPPLPTAAPAQTKPVAPPLKLRKRAKPKPTIAATPTKTPIHGVLELLQEKDALVSAFLLREILGPPVSKRR